MSGDSKKGGQSLVRFDEAMQLVEQRSGDDLAMRQFVGRAVTLVVVARTQGKVPTTPLDMVFYVERMFDFYEQREALRRIFDGEDLRWWDDM